MRPMPRETLVIPDSSPYGIASEWEGALAPSHIVWQGKFGLSPCSRVEACSTTQVPAY